MNKKTINNIITNILSALDLSFGNSFIDNLSEECIKDIRENMVVVMEKVAQKNRETEPSTSNNNVQDSISLQNEAAQIINESSVLSDNQSEILQRLNDSIAKLESMQ